MDKQDTVIRRKSIDPWARVKAFIFPFAVIALACCCCVQIVAMTYEISDEMVADSEGTIGTMYLAQELVHTRYLLQDVYGNLYVVDKEEENDDTKSDDSSSFSPGADSGASIAGGVAPDSLQEYVVQPGDTLTFISHESKIGIDEIATENGIVDPNMISVGQKLVIPEERGSEYLIQPGDTLTVIAYQTGNDLEELSEYNKMIDDNKISEGAYLRLPEEEK